MRVCFRRQLNEQLFHKRPQLMSPNGQYDTVRSAKEDLEWQANFGLKSRLFSC